MIVLAFIIIGAVIGAGFATGAEVIAFFGNSALPIPVIAILVGLFFFGITYLMILAHSKEVGKITKKVSDIFFAIIYFVVFVAMIAGLAELTSAWVAAIGVLLCIAVVWFGFEKMLSINKYLIAFVLVVLLIASCMNLGHVEAVKEPQSIGRSVLQCLLYAGMNCCILDALIAESLKKWNRRKVIISSFIAFTIICVFVALILIAIRANNISAAMPLLELSNNIFTKIAIFLSIMTSMYVCLFNTDQIVAPKLSNKWKIIKLLGISAAAYGLSFFGFVEIIGTVYPILGALMICFIICILIIQRFYKPKKEKP